MGSVQGKGTVKKLSVILLDLFKPVQTAFLAASGVISYIVSSKGLINWRILFLLTISLYFTIAGTTGLNMYLDKDIDSIMERTRKRALPSGKINGSEAVAASVAFLALGLITSLLINWGVLLAAVLGSLIDLVIYTWMLKRKTPLNVVFGSIAGGMPALGGWLAHPNSSVLGGLLLSSVVALWSLNHIWFIASYYSLDYIRAKVPMLPLLVERKSMGFVSNAVSSAILLLLATMWYFGELETWALAVLGAFLIYLSFLQLRYSKAGSRDLAKKVFRGYTAFLGTTMIVLLIGAIA